MEHGEVYSSDGSLNILSCPSGVWTVGHLSSVVESTDLMDACIRIAGYMSSR